MQFMKSVAHTKKHLINCGRTCRSSKIASHPGHTCAKEEENNAVDLKIQYKLELVGSEKKSNQLMSRGEFFELTRHVVASSLICEIFF